MMRMAPLLRWRKRGNVSAPSPPTFYYRRDTFFAHELGHNMGLRHDRYVLDREERTASPYPFGFGYVNQRAFEPGAPASSRWRTIMAYQRQCGDAGFRCESPLLFANPALIWRGDRLGVPGDNWSSSLVGPADARRTLNESRFTIAD